jgi:hypothetical protein
MRGSAPDAYPFDFTIWFYVRRTKMGRSAHDDAARIPETEQTLEEKWSPAL